MADGQVGVGKHPIFIEIVLLYKRPSMKNQMFKNIFRVAVGGLMLAPSWLSAQSILLTAEDFVLLAGTAVTVAGPGPNTYSNGDVGAAASISGFPPATVVNGTTILGGVIVGQALDDLITARNGLSALPSPAANNLTNVNGGDLATQILAPGVYTFDVAASLSLNGVLTLDAQGKNNVTWVINIATSLTTGANAKIEFINLGTNGGMDNGLFWNAGSAITLGATNVIAGNYLAGTDITFGTTVPGEATSSGRALALAGVSFDGAAMMDVLGGPGSGDFTGGLTMHEGSLVTSGYVLLSAAGSYTNGASTVVLKPGQVYNTLGVIVDGSSADTNALAPAQFTVFQTIATLAGQNSYTGGTVVDGGVLTTGSQNLPDAGAVSLIDSNETGTVGAIIFDQAVDGVFAGSISGAGSLTKENTAELTLTGANTYTGGTFVNEGTLVASTETLPTAGEITLAADTVLVLDEASNSTYTGNISGNGTLEKQGAGALELSNPTTALIDIQAGAFFIGADIGATTVAFNGFLGGAGTINGNLFNNGLVSPGFSPGTIFVVGDYTQGANGTLIIEFASDTSFDQLVVSGSASLDGTLQLDLLGGYTPVGQSFEVLTATNGVTGTFAAITGNSATLAPDVTYNPFNVTVAFIQVPFVVFAGTPNQTAIAVAAIDSPALSNALNNVPLASQLPEAMNAISPQGYQVWSEIALDHATSITDRVARNEAELPDNENFYFEGGQRRGSIRSDSDVGKTDYRTNFGLLGANFAVGPNFKLGGFFEYSKTDSGLGSSGSHSDIERMTLGARAAWSMDQWFVHSVLAYSFADYDSVRSIRFPGTNETAESQTSDHQWIGNITAGRHFDAGAVTLTPFVGLLASAWEVDGFTETGAGAFNATVDSQSVTSWRTQLGLEVSGAYEMNGIRVLPHVRAAWVHDLSDSQRSMDASIDGVDFRLETSETSRDRLLVGTGVGVYLSDHTLLYASYSAQFADRSGDSDLSHQWLIGLNHSF